ncbi:hypothetical protein Tco_1536801 [Tanacetum coccineum]
MCTYLKNMAGWKPKDLKNKSFANIQEVFDQAFKRVNTLLMEVQRDTQPLFRCLEALTRKIWKLCGNWLKLSMGIQDQSRDMRECYGVSKYACLYVGVEKRYPLTPATITAMLNTKLQAMKKLDDFEDKYQV